LGSRCVIARRPILTICASHDVLPQQDVPFGVPLLPLPIPGIKAPKIGQTVDEISQSDAHRSPPTGDRPLKFPLSEKQDIGRI